MEGYSYLFHLFKFSSSEHCIIGSFQTFHQRSILTFQFAASSCTYQEGTDVCLVKMQAFTKGLRDRG